MTEENKETKLEEKEMKSEIGDKNHPEKKVEEKKDAKKETRKPKSEAFVNSFNAHLSTKTSAYVCRFIVGKTIDEAIRDLELVIVQKKVVPMKGEMPHRKGQGIAGGRYPKNAAEHFIKLLKTLAGNSNVNRIEEPIIVEAIANIGERPYGKFGAVRRKRTHIKIIAKNKMKKDKR